MTKKPELTDNQEIFKHLSVLTELGWIMVSTILIGFGLGYFLDSKLGHFPLWTILCLLLGIASGFWTVYKRVMAQFKDKGQ